MSDPDRTGKKGYRFIAFRWKAPEGKILNRVIFAPGVTGEEAYEIIRYLGWLDHRDGEE